MEKYIKDRYFIPVLCIVFRGTGQHLFANCLRLPCKERNSGPVACHFFTPNEQRLEFQGFATKEVDVLELGHSDAKTRVAQRNKRPRQYNESALRNPYF